MPAKRNKRKPSPSRFHIGQRVRFEFGVRTAEGVIVEDRGFIGVGGRRLWRVESKDDPYFPFAIELGEEEMEPVACPPDVPPDTRPSPPPVGPMDGAFPPIEEVPSIPAKASKGKPPPSRFHVGQRVRFLFGLDKVEGVIVEDRGFIGVGGRRLWRVESKDDPYFPFAIELGEEEMEPVA
jgi:hypothetical protein